MQRQHVKRETDLQIISTWVEEGQRVLDLGCGRGVLLEHLAQSKAVYGVGVDLDLGKAQACIRRGVNVYQGDALSLMKIYPDRAFDWVILSRTVQELEAPRAVFDEALRVGCRVAVGFVNFGYWKNRLSLLWRGALPRNEVFPLHWEEGSSGNSVAVRTFESFCERNGIRMERTVYLRGDWQRRCRFGAGFRAGYALYALSRATEATPALAADPPMPSTSHR
ncbi:MAG: methyltransferase domain-containing protein [Opitutales bacterium]|nr:methyltransferase domain-containing protein [Opitutales bacterium]